MSANPSELAAPSRGLLVTLRTSISRDEFFIGLYILGCAVIGISATTMLTDYTNRDISEEYDKTRPVQPARAQAD